METPDLYCDECGAANPREARTCCACHRPLSASLIESPDSPDQHEIADLSGPFLLHLDLETGTVTRTSLPAPKPKPALLHNRYEVLDKVGTGGFGAVYKARDTRHNNRLVAIKAIELDALSAAQAIEATDTFNRELSLLSSLEHINLPRLYEHFIDSTHWYLVMDFINGEPLDEYLQQIQEACLPLPEVIDIGLQLCEVLRYLHQLTPPIIFRDVKPANIMRTPGGRIYLIDFGIARRFKPGQARDTTPLGSPGFAAPEQYGRTQTTALTDIYGLGATLYFLLTGYDLAATPFNLPPIRDRCPSLPGPLEVLITRMLALDPAERPSSMEIVRDVLWNYVPLAYGATSRAFHIRSAQLHAPMPPTAPPPPMPAQSPARPRRLSAFLKGLFSP
jgi:serine/threonine protein kinase